MRRVKVQGCTCTEEVDFRSPGQIAQVYGVDIGSAPSLICQNGEHCYVMVEGR